MTRNTLLDINKLTPYAVGFDQLFDQMSKYIDGPAANPGYPPYNISGEDNQYKIDIALAGVDKNDVSIELEQDVLVVSYKPSTSENKNWLYKGVANRAFTRRFTLSENVVVTSANMVNGMLTIHLERIVPEKHKPKKILIS